MNDSTTGGPLPPEGGVVFVGSGPIAFEGADQIDFNGSGFADPLEDEALDDFFQSLVVGITGLAGHLVMPRWQEEPPNLPPRSQNWAAIGIINRTADVYAVVEHNPAGEGWDRVTRHEELELLVSFYGPNAGAYGGRLRDGLSVAQNREPLFLADMGLKEVGDLRKAPELIKNAWYARTDLTFYVRRQIVRAYAVRNLLSGHATVSGGPITSTIATNP